MSRASVKAVSPYSFFVILFDCLDLSPKILLLLSVYNAVRSCSHVHRIGLTMLRRRNTHITADSLARLDTEAKNRQMDIGTSMMFHFYEEQDPYRKFLVVGSDPSKCKTPSVMVIPKGDKKSESLTSHREALLTYYR